MEELSQRHKLPAGPHAFPVTHLGLAGWPAQDPCFSHTLFPGVPRDTHSPS